MFHRNHSRIAQPITEPRGRSTKRWTRSLRNAVSRTLYLMRPTLISLAFMAAGSAAHAQGTMDFSGADTLMQTFKTFAMYAGAVICLGGLIFAGIRMMTGRFQDAIPGLFGALFGAAVLGWEPAGSQTRLSHSAIAWTLSP